MANDSSFRNDPGLDRWVSERIAALTPGNEFPANSASAAVRFRALRDSKSRRDGTWGWAAAAAAMAWLLFLALPAPKIATQHYLNFGFDALLQGVPVPSDRPEYSGSQLVRPVDYREWIYLSSGLGMEYNASAGGPENFTNVFVPQWAYKAFLATGKWPDKSMFVLESRASQTKGSINKTGHFQADLAGLAVEVKDETRFADKWAYFNFRGDTNVAAAMTGPSDGCWKCHDANAAVEHTFVQFYPTLKPVALKFGTYRAQAD